MASREYGAELLNRRRLLNDDKQLIEDAGSLISLWNGLEKEKSVTLMISCGSYSKWLGNNVGIELVDLGDLRNVDRMCESLAAIGEAWEPEWAGVMSQAAMDARDFSAKKPFVDWMLYLSNAAAPQLPAMARPTSVQQIGTTGSLIVVQPEPPDPSNLDHLRNIQQVEKALQAVTR